ncbi:hypothetical protein NQ314_013343 [Rhamnusium bicolor]|uniref:Mitochondrial carrier protein n=1 Tax=Rhamnusium bicolor TaxID=1586634 RepID=A0AAV8X661_9CUCU|nr:hypothetical protein NQ314_013343 [Rhamnusium bicolor]
MYHAFEVVKRNYSFKEYYRGFSIIVLRNSAANCCFFITKAELQKYSDVCDSIHKENLKNFCSGGFLGMFMSTLFYPLKVMKVTVQRQLGGPFIGFYQVAVLVYNRDGGGINNFYQGVLINASRSLLSWGVTNMTFEFLKKTI